MACRLTAYHEAAHGVAHISYGLAVIKIWLTPEDPKLAGFCALKEVPFDPEDEEFRRSIGVGLLAGLCSELKLGVPIEAALAAARTDLEIWRSEFPNHSIWWYEHEARQFVHEKWLVISAVAEELLRCGSMSGAELHQLCHTLCETP
jgi:hypothetical protein